MSSFNFRKLKQTDVKPLLRHCDKYMRPKANHSNIHINKELSMKNVQLKRTYKETCKLYDDTLAELDSKPRSNRRIDRVSCYVLESVIMESQCDDTKKEEEKTYQWIKGVIDILKNDYPEIVVLQWYIHRDEQHEYLNPETGKYVMSSPHVHIFVMPIVEGKLNSKKFFPNKKAFYDFNKKMDNLTISLYGHPFGDGTKKKSFSTVEQLKIASEKAELEARRKAAQEAEKDLLNREAALRQQEQIIEEREQDVNSREAKMMAFINSDIGKKAMREYDASIRRNTAIPVSGKKQAGKIKQNIETENEFK